MVWSEKTDFIPICIIRDEKSAKNIGGYRSNKNSVALDERKFGLQRPPLLPMVGLINDRDNTKSLICTIMVYLQIQQNMCIWYNTKE